MLTKIQTAGSNIAFDVLSRLEKVIETSQLFKLRRQYLDACEQMDCTTLNDQGLRRYFASGGCFNKNAELFINWVRTHYAETDPEIMPHTHIDEEGFSIESSMALKVYADLRIVSDTQQGDQSIELINPIMRDGNLADSVSIKRVA